MHVGYFVVLADFSCHAVVKSPTNAEHFCVTIAGELLDPESQSLAKQSNYNLAKWFEQVLQFKADHVEICHYSPGK